MDRFKSFSSRKKPPFVFSDKFLNNFWVWCFTSTFLSGDQFVRFICQEMATLVSFQFLPPMHHSRLMDTKMKDFYGFFFWMKWNVSKIKSIILAQRRFKQRLKEKESRNGGLHSAEVAFLLLTQQPQVWMLAFPKIYFDVAEIYKWKWLEESGQRLQNDDQTHLALDSGK